MYTRILAFIQNILYPIGNIFAFACVYQSFFFLLSKCTKKIKFKMYKFVAFLFDSKNSFPLVDDPSIHKRDSFQVNNLSCRTDFTVGQMWGKNGVFSTVNINFGNGTKSEEHGTAGNFCYLPDIREIISIIRSNEASI